MKKIFISLLTLLVAAKIAAQPPVVAKPQAKPVALVGGMAHLGNGQVIGNAVITFENGKITEVAEAGNAKPDPARYEVIDVSGKHIYPGLIAPNSRLGLDEVGSVKATQDNTETGVVNANVRSLVSYNTDSEHIPVTRANGILLAQVTPEGAVVSGTSSVVQLEAWNWEDAAYRKDDGLYLNWPAYFASAGRFEEATGPAKKNDKRDAVLQELDRTFIDGLAYSQIKNPVPVNLKLEAMRGLYDGKKTLYVRADYGKEIIEAVQFAQSHGVKKVVVVGATDAWMVVDFLKENNVPVILNALHRLPSREEEDVDMPYKLPALLHKAGVLVGLAYGEGPMQLRNLPFVAGNAAGYGLTKEEALMLVTANNAKILGIDDKTGTLAVGKDANLVVSSGDLLDMRTNDVTHAFVGGRLISLDNKHKRLYGRFNAKYGF
jgi:imidazolonepropionase-like amidohydrolase